MINTVFLRTAPYRDVWDRQIEEFDRRVGLRKAGLTLPDDLIIFAEHLPVYTLGRHGNMENLLLSENILKQNGVEVHRIERGGDITYHGPGQLTVYPILDLQRYNLGVKGYVNLLEEAVIRTIGEYGIKGERIEGATGVWIDKGNSKERKISAIGIRCSRYVTMHGVSLNVGSDIHGFSSINPCGFIEKGVTSVSLEMNSEIEIEEVKEKLESNLIDLLQLRIVAQGNL